MSDPVPTPSWRKRHPVLARAVLYGLGAVLVGVTLLLLMQRREQDDAVRLESKRMSLDNLDLIYVLDPSGRLVLKALDEQFSGPDLEPDLRQRVLRWRGFALAAQQDAEGANRTYGEAAMGDLPRREAGALFLEWARARMELEDPEGALFLLDRPQIVSTGPLGLVTATVRTRVRSQMGDGVQALAYLEMQLAALPVPLPPEPTDWICPVTWSWSDAAVTATEELVALKGLAQAGAQPWQRLLALAPTHFEAQWKAAQALEALVHPEAADRAWAQAVALAPAEIEALCGKQPGLAALEARRLGR